MRIPISISNFSFMEDPAPWSVEGKGSKENGLGAYGVVLLGNAMSTVAVLGLEGLVARLAWERVHGQVFFGWFEPCCGCNAIVC